MPYKDGWKCSHLYATRGSPTSTGTKHMPIDGLSGMIDFARVVRSDGLLADVSCQTGPTATCEHTVRTEDSRVNLAGQGRHARRRAMIRTVKARWWSRRASWTSLSERMGGWIAVRTTAVIAVVGRERAPTGGEEARRPFERLPRQRVASRKLCRNPSQVSQGDGGLRRSAMPSRLFRLVLRIPRQQQPFVCQAQHDKNQQAQQNVAGGAKQICCSVCARVKIAWWPSARVAAMSQPAMCAEVACVSRTVRAAEASMPLSMSRG